MNESTLNLPLIANWIILGLSMLLAVWMIYDSSQRYKIRWQIGRAHV